MITPADVMQAAPAAARPVPGLAPLFASAAICAPAATCACTPGDNLALHRALTQAAPGSVLVCAVGGDHSTAYLGELMAEDARNRGLVGLVVDGPVRDAAAVEALGWPVFHVGLNPASPEKRTVVSCGAAIVLAGIAIEPGDQVVADRDGVLVVPRARWESVEATALRVREREASIRAALASGTRLADLLHLPGVEGAAA